MGNGVLLVIFGHGKKEQFLGMQEEASRNVVYYFFLSIFGEDGKL